MTKDRVLVVSSTRGLARTTKRALVSAGYEVESSSAESEGLEQHLEEPFDLFIADTHADLQVLADALKKRGREESVPAMLLITRELGNQLVFEQIVDRGLNNIIAKHGGVSACHDRVDESELITTVGKLLSGDIFGLEKYLPMGKVAVHRRTLTCSEDRADALHELEGFLTDLDCYSRIQPMVVATADELLMNAIFSAPRDATGNPKYDELDRREKFALEPHEHVEFSFACDGRHVLLSVTDSFGSLDRDILLRYLRRGLLEGRGSVQHKAGGAGLGLFMVVNNMTQLVFNIERQRRTEIIASFYVRGSLKELRASGQSLNLFIIG